MHLTRSYLSLSVILMIFALPLAALGQVPDVPPPTMDQEGTERSWDITHPGWRELLKKPEVEVNDAELDAMLRGDDEQAERLAEAAEEQRKRGQEQRLRQLQAMWQQQAEQERRQHEQQQQLQAAERQRLFEQARQLLVASFQAPSDAPAGNEQTPVVAGGARPAAAVRPYVESFGPSIPLTPQGRAGLSPIEWQQAGQYQSLVDVLSQSPAATTEDRTLLDIAEVRRNQLWSKAVSVPGLPDDGREALALSLPVVAAPDCPRLTLQEAGTLQKSIQSIERPADAVVTAMLSDLYVYTTSEAAGLAGEAMVKRVLDEDAAGHFGDFLGVSKIALAAAQDGASSGIAATADFFIGKIPLPQSTVAVTGGRQYANVAYQVQSKFMVDAMQAAGADFDVQEFWRNFKEDLTTGQKAVMEFVSYGPQN
ncbi:MAG: hypothetical protein ABFE01_14920, partial [Phycisphaerales bacterium]